jgi:hypothetical protein
MENLDFFGFSTFLFYRLHYSESGPQSQKSPTVDEFHHHTKRRVTGAQSILFSNATLLDKVRIRRHYFVHMPSVNVCGLGDNGVHVISLKSDETALNDLFQKIEEYSGILKKNQILLCSKHHEAIRYKKNQTTLLVDVGITNGCNIDFVRNFKNSQYPTLSIRMGVCKFFCLKYISGAMITLSTVAFLSRVFIGYETITETYSPTLSFLAWWPVSYFLGFAGVCTAAFDIGHWLAGYPILPAALFTLVNKGTIFSKAQETQEKAETTLGRMELELVKVIKRYIPSLIKESGQTLGQNSRGIRMLQKFYGATRVRFECCDGVAIDGMHIKPAKKKNSGAEDEKCYIVVNGNAEFYETDGLLRE